MILHRKWLLILMAGFWLVLSACSKQSAVFKSRAQTIPSGGEATIVYLDNGDLWRNKVGFVNGEPQALGEVERLTAVSNIIWAELSPNKEKIAYLRQPDNTTTSLHISNSDGTENIQVAHSDFLTASGAGTDLRLIDTIQWLDDNQTLAFNTYRLEEGSEVANEDLWQLTLGFIPEERFSPSEGGAFAIANDAQRTTLLVRQIDDTTSELVRTSLNGAEVDALFTFPTIIEDGKIDYPQPAWTDDQLAYMTVPEQSDDISWRTTSLWRIPVQGDASLLAKLPGRIEPHEIAWSEVGEKLAYVQPVSDRNHQLFVSADNLVVTYEGSGRLALLDWQEDGNNFLYTRNNMVRVGEQTTLPIALDAQFESTVVAGEWINGRYFLIVSGTENAWDVGIGTTDGKFKRLFKANSESPIIDVSWQEPPPPTPTPLPTNTPWPTATASPWPTAIPTTVPWPTATPQPVQSVIDNSYVANSAAYYRRDYDYSDQCPLRDPQSLELSLAGALFIEETESFRRGLYNDFAGNCSVGVGFLVREGERCRPVENVRIHNQVIPLTYNDPNSLLTDSEVQALFRAQLGHWSQVTHNSLSVPMSQQQFDALVSFAFNTGYAVQELGAYINNGNIDGAMAFMRSRNKAQDPSLGYIDANNPQLGYVRRPYDALIKRRELEISLFQYGVYRHYLDTRTSIFPKPC